jgi:hypothetical protein
MNAVRAAVLVASLALFMAFTTVPAQAEPQDGPCKEDAERLCKGVPPGGERVWSCLREHQAQLSDACKDHVRQGRSEGRERYQACKADVQNFCGGSNLGGGRLRQCLKEHEASLSAACKAELSEGGRK